MHVFHKVLLISALMGFTAQAYATGCDCSCFGVKETILKADQFIDDFSFTRDGNNLRLHPIPNRYNKMPSEDIIITGYKERGPIHPELLDRIVAKQPHSYLVIMNQRLEIENDYCNVANPVAETGRYEIQIRFDTGETVTLYHPTDEALFEPEDGSIRTEAILPSPFGYLNQGEKKP